MRINWKSTLGFQIVKGPAQKQIQPLEVGLLEAGACGARKRNPDIQELDTHPEESPDPWFVNTREGNPSRISPFG